MTRPQVLRPTEIDQTSSIYHLQSTSALHSRCLRLLRVELLDKRLCYSIDLAIVPPELTENVAPGHQHAETRLVNPQAAIVWYFGPSAQRTHGSTELSLPNSVRREPSDVPGEDCYMDWVDVATIDPCADEVLADIASGNVGDEFGFHYLHSESASIGSPGANDQPLTNQQVSGRDDIGFSGQVSQGGQPEGWEREQRHVHRESAPLGGQQGSTSPALSSESALGRPVIAPVTQLPIPEGEGPDSGHKPVSSPTNGSPNVPVALPIDEGLARVSPSASPSSSLRERELAVLAMSASRSTSQRGEHSDQALSDRDYNEQKKPASFVSLEVDHLPVLTHSPQRYGWRGTVGPSQIRPTRDAESNPGLRPLLAPVPELPSSTTGSREANLTMRPGLLPNRCSPSAAADRWSTRVNRMPEWSQAESSFTRQPAAELDDAMGNSSQLAMVESLDDLLPADAEPQAESATAWYWAAIPVLLCVPKRIRKRMRRWIV